MQINVKPDPDKNLATNNAGNGNGNAIVRVESAAGEGLDELFKAVMSPNIGQSRLPQQVPMRQRRLPPSFFRPPSAGSSNSVVSGNHSRESSLDGGYQSVQSPAAGSTGQSNKMNGGLGYTPNGLAIIHPRANSSPAALQPANVSNSGQTFGSSELGKPSTNGTTSASNVSHFRQMSYDQMVSQISLPDGWGMLYTDNGQPYFLNHKEKTTTWEDPRKKLVEDMIRRGNLNSSHQMMIPPQGGSQPQPTIPPAPQSAISQPVGSRESESLPYIDFSIVPLPDGWQQVRARSGAIYFISQIEQESTWYHPSIPRNLQMKHVQEQQQKNRSVEPPPFQNNSNIPLDLVVALQNMNTSCQTQNTSTTSLDQTLKSQQSQHLRDLELERERMRQRQEELMQSSLLSSSASNLLLSSSSEPNQSSFMLQNECHSRQESVDSGLDLGNSNNYSMPHTPDDFLRLSNTNGTNSSSTAATRSSNGSVALSGLSDDLSFDNMPGLDLDSESMDFMQGLQDMDLLSNVEELLNTNKDNIMTWL